MDYADTYSTVLSKIEKTIQFRRNELYSGLIEAGENVDVNELEIFSQDVNTFIIPKQERKLKCASTYNDYITFIDTE
jgi:hypothetical protein